MLFPSFPPNEQSRLEALNGYDILDTPAEESYDDFTKLASLVCETPVSLISLIDKDRQWFKSKMGLEIEESPRELSFCGHAILQRDLFIIEDATLDARFSDNPFVAEDPQIRFYAGVPLVNEDDYALGTLCIIDFKPRKLTDKQKEILLRLGRQLIARMEMRKTMQALQGSEAFRSAILTSALDAIIIIDNNGKLVEFNPAAETMFGYQREEVLGKQMVDILVPEHLREAHNTGFSHYLSSGEGPVLGKRIEVPALNAAGELFDIELAITPIRLKNSVFFSAYLRDISERKKAEARVNTQQAITRVLAEANSYEEALPDILQEICKGLGLAVGCSWEIDWKNQILSEGKVWSREPEAMRPMTEKLKEKTFEKGEGLPGKVWQQKKPEWLADIVETPCSNIAEPAEICGIHGVLAFPIQVESTPQGVLAFFSQGDLKPEPELLAMFSTIGSQIGQFTVRKRAENRLAKLNQTLLQLGPDISANLQMLAENGGGLLNAVVSDYYHLTAAKYIKIGEEDTGELPLKSTILHQCMPFANALGTAVLYRQDEDEHWPEGMKTFVGQLVRLDGDLVGILGLYYSHHFTLEADEQELLTILCSALIIEEERWQASLQLSEARRQEVKIAARIQKTLLTGPSSLVGEGYEVAAKSTPSSKVDGDFYDLISLRSGATDILIGDVMGKGVGAALLGAACKTAIQRSISRMLLAGDSPHVPSPREVIASLHADIVPTLIDLESFVTLSYARLSGDGKKIKMVNCGHTSGLIRHADGTLTELVGSNMPMGFSLRETYNEVEYEVSPGDSLVLYSDGITEAQNLEGEMFGMEGLKASLSQCELSQPDEVIEKIFHDVSCFSNQEQLADDLTMLVVSFKSVVFVETLFNENRKFPAEMAQLQNLRKACIHFCEEVKGVELPEGFIDQWVLAVNEAATNIIHHSYHGESGHHFYINMERLTNGMRAHLVHQGDAFAGRSTSKNSIDDRQDSGFGMFIMEQAVDRVEYLRLDSGENAILLEKKF